MVETERSLSFRVGGAGGAPQAWSGAEQRERAIEGHEVSRPLESSLGRGRYRHMGN